MLIKISPTLTRNFVFDLKKNVSGHDFDKTITAVLCIVSEREISRNDIILPFTSWFYYNYLFPLCFAIKLN